MEHKTARLVGPRLRQAIILRIALYSFYILVAVLIGATEAREDESVNAVAKTADVIGLFAFSILSLQFILSSRLPWMERPFGLDRLMRFHRRMGITVAVLLVAHPILMAASGEPDLLTKLYVAWPIQLGRIAVLILFATVVVSLRRTALRIPFERWRFWHNVGAISVLVLAFAHSFFVEGGVHTSLGRVFWSVLAASALAGWGYRYFLEWHEHYAGRYTVAAVIPEARNTWTLVLVPDNGHSIPTHLPGQFAFIEFKEGPVAGEEHPFTIASSPEQEELAFTIRTVGDFTGRIAELSPGAKVFVHGPFGRFSASLYPEEQELVFIAGGVGLTPFLSMLRSMHRSGTMRPVTVLHACRTEQDLLMRQELTAMAEASAGSLRVVHILSSPDGTWQGLCGHLDGELLADHVGEHSDTRGFYICGPPGMMTAVKSDLRKLGIPKARIHTERFAL